MLPKVCGIKVTNIKVSDLSDIFMTGAIAGSGTNEQLMSFKLCSSAALTKPSLKRAGLSWVNVGYFD